MLLLFRLKNGGAEARLSRTQYGFRAGRSTREPILLLQAMLSEAVAKKNGSLTAILLDWEKAFDRLDPQRMLKALRVFGIPAEFCEMVAAIYVDRKFVVADAFGASAAHAQDSGIAQGCPLSP